MGAASGNGSGNDDVRTELPEDLGEVSDFFRAIGKQIKLLREQAGLTQKELGERIGYGEHLISAVERGLRTPQPEFLIAVDRELNAGGLLAIAKDDVMRARNKARVRHPAWFRGYVELEPVAVEIHEHSMYAIPGLLQTEAHARALYGMRQPLLTEEVIEERVTSRIARQEILTRWPRAIFSWVIDESILLRPLGGWDVHKEQLIHLLTVGQMRGMAIQVMPLNRGAHAGLGGPFTLITPKGRPQTGYIEAQQSSRLITDQEEVRIMNARYGALRAQAHTPEESLTLIEKMLGER
ncbi:helix-turn-helix transcriptional regulator [Kitasatospora sp. SUK 42]|uniref:helix-turn-helix domain-containing protein n=1 Tax=Kitasatospora sp. SUK 42 TaxID=1588882 RepID=UPI0018CBE57F|nr:helix-turn-helix transcriptional regulator [Kitasatospora sp. SUK 42]MBV2153346.1 helix-turn-helix transcriptional regulator [Kitasatospora sp. SUK 42]